MATVVGWFIQYSLFITIHTVGLPQNADTFLFTSDDGGECVGLWRFAEGGNHLSPASEALPEFDL